MDPTPSNDSLRRSQAIARLLDDAVRVPGTNVRIGLDPVFSLLPVGGDALSALASLYVVFEARRAGVPRSTLVRMVANLLADFALGSVPVIGVLFDALVRANRRNVELFEAHVERTDTERWEREAVEIDLDA